MQLRHDVIEYNVMAVRILHAYGMEHQDSKKQITVTKPP